MIPLICIAHTVNITFYDELMDDKKTVAAEIGKKVVDIAIENKLNLEGTPINRSLAAC
jgi:hypothetical protein